MNKSVYCIISIIFIILGILGIYNYTHPITQENVKIIKEGEVLNITEEYDYNENSEYIEKYYAEVEINDSLKEHVNILLNENEEHKIGEKVRVVEEKGEYIFTDEQVTKNKIIVGWLILSIVEFIIAIVCIVKFIKKG